MATANPFLLLGDDDENDDPHHLAQKLPPPTPKPTPGQAAAAQAQPAKNAKLPSKPLPPAQAVREAKSDGTRGGGRSGGRGAGRGRGGRGYNRESPDNENDFESNNGFSGGYRGVSVEGDVEKSSERRGYGAPRGGFRGGGRRGGYSNGDSADGEHPKRVYERRSGTGLGNGVKRDGSGRGNWGTPTDDVAMETGELVIETEKVVDAEKPAAQEDASDAQKQNPEKEPEEKEPEEKEPEEKEMTLEEYEKVLEEKRKALLVQKSEERKVVLDKDFETMQVLSSKKGEEEIFAKLGTDKDKRKEAADKEERAKKSVPINEFLKPAEGEKYYNPGGRGRGRGRGPRGGGGRFNGGRFSDASAPSIGDASQFPSLGVK